MRILYHHRIASKDGQYVHVSEIVSSLLKLGVELRMISPSPADAQRFGSELGWVARLKRRLPKSCYEALELGYAVVDFVKMVWAIASWRPQVIYERYNLFFPSGVLASTLFRVPLILEVNAPLLDERRKYGGVALERVARWTERYVWRNADIVLPVTEVLAARIREEGVDAARIRVIPNGVNASQFSQPTKPKRIATLEGRVVVGFVGFCREWHALDKVVALIAADQSKQLALLIVGDGPVLPQLKEDVRRLGCGDRVHFAGLVAREEMPAWLATIDVAIQPSVVPYASPLKLIEYMATGKAIVAPAQSNICELLSHEKNALLFPEGDSGAFMAALRRLAADSQLRTKLAAAARDTVRSRSLLWDENAGKILALAEQLTSERQAPG